ncbi:hypothetical protein GH5_08528 [Leishmania sp. Ghana 2012 LV757]|uniref:hypothetical protein n=1 Tax=Leishmania sp. Ghana 2012 LV757 TaxID=2803181 RepID=UPI001B48069E|nr:hypothetical protein GH5_08528 [Leishmania sp. Ghana 2012 LV757]
MRRAAHLPRACATTPPSTPSALRYCRRRLREDTTYPLLLLLLLSIAVLVSDGVELVLIINGRLSSFNDAALPRRRSSGLFAMAAGEADAANTAAGTPPSPLPTITETELISVDLGHDSMKVSAWRVQQQQQPAPLSETAEGGVAAATTSAGSASIVLNDQTHRKSPPCVAFRCFRDEAAAPDSAGVLSDTGPGMLSDSEQTHAHRPYTALHPRGYQLERTFAEQALALAPRFPMQVVCSAAQLLGHTADSMNGTAADSTTHALASEQLRVVYGYDVAPLTRSRLAGTATANGAGEAQQQQNSVVGRQALGVYVPFFTTSDPPGQQGQRATGDSRTVSAAANSGALFSSEELTAMLLGYARRMAEKADAADSALSEEDERLLAEARKAAGNSTGNADAAAGETRAAPAPAATRYAALTVPIHATVAQRQALVDAAALAGLRVVRLVHSTSGAAAQLAYMKAEQVLKLDKVQYVMIYDMGSHQAEVAIYSFAALPAAVASRTKLQGNVELQALVGSRTLGGAAFDECIAKHWDARYFGRRVLSAAATAAGRSEAVRRAAAKERGSLLRAAQRAKEILSADYEAHVTIDGVHADPSRFDAGGRQELQQRRVAVTAEGGLLSLRLSRGEFEKLCSPLFDAAVALRDDAIAATGGLVQNPGALDRFEVIGGGTRMPRLLQRLGEGYRGGVVDRTLNGDEAAVMGTTLLAVSSAPSTLRLRGGHTLPRYHMREWLTSAVYASVELRSTGAEATATAAAPPPPEVRLLFPALNTTLPATRSLRVRLPAEGMSPTDSVIVTLYSGAEVDSAYASSKRTDAAQTANSAIDAASATLGTRCSSCYVRACTVEGLHKAVEQLLTQVTQQKSQHSSAKPRRKQVRLVGAEVVIEVVATVSGIPHCSVAYLRSEMESAGAGFDVTGNEHSEGAAVPQDSQTGEPGEREEDEVKLAGARTNMGGTPDPATEGATASSAPPSHVEVGVLALYLRVSSGASTTGAAKGVGYNMDAAELAFSRRRVRELQAIDDVRLRRSTLRNEIEGALVWIKENNPTWDSEDVQSDATPLPSLPQGWRATVREVGNWLDDFGDTANVSALEERLRTMAGVKAALREALRH